MSDYIIYLVPLLALLCTVAVMMIVMFMFDSLRGTVLKGWSVKFWPADERRALHLSKQNGFHVLVDSIIKNSHMLVRYSWGIALLSILGGPRCMLTAAFLVALCYLVRSAFVTFLAHRKVKQFSLPHDYDGYGVYAQTADEWRQMKHRSKLILTTSGVVCIILLINLFIR